ncbi:MAG: hypothetical protein ACYC6F_17275 [Longimicrobiales bacterium]
MEQQQGVSRVVRDDPGFHAAAAVAEADVPGTGIRERDVVIYEGVADGPCGVLRPGSRWHRLPRREFGALRAAVEEGRVRVASGGYEGGESAGPERGKARLLAYLASPNARRGRDETSPILVARPLRSHVSEAILAASVDGALFELLLSVGCRMPVGGAR